jgi:hypothetical protein
MKYKYKFDEIIYESGNKRRIIIMENDKYSMVAQALMSDVQGADAWDSYYEAIDNVLTAKSTYEELNGNSCGVEIQKEQTKIFDNIAEDGMGDWCEIETTEFKKLIDIWYEELKKFKKNQQASK